MLSFQWGYTDSTFLGYFILNLPNIRQLYKSCNVTKHDYKSDQTFKSTSYNLNIALFLLWSGCLFSGQMWDTTHRTLPERFQIPSLKTIHAAYLHNRKPNCPSNEPYAVKAEVLRQRARRRRWAAQRLKEEEEAKADHEESKGLSDVKSKEKRECDTERKSTVGRQTERWRRGGLWVLQCQLMMDLHTL